MNMLGSECQLTHRNVLYSAEAPRRHLVAIAFLFVLAIPKTAEQTLSSGAILPSSQTYPATLSYQRVVPSLPRGAPTRAGRRSSDASPWASPGKAPSCPCCRRGAPLPSAPSSRPY